MLTRRIDSKNVNDGLWDGVCRPDLGLLLLVLGRDGHKMGDGRYHGC